MRGRCGGDAGENGERLRLLPAVGLALVPRERVGFGWGMGSGWASDLGMSAVELAPAVSMFTPPPPFPHLPPSRVVSSTPADTICTICLNKFNEAAVRNFTLNKFNALYETPQAILHETLDCLRILLLTLRSLFPSFYLCGLTLIQCFVYSLSYLPICI